MKKNALILFLVSVSIFSLFPLFNALSVGSVPPLLYVAKACFIAVFIQSLILTVYAHRKQRNFIFHFKRMKKQSFMWLSLAAVIAVCSYYFLIRSFYYAPSTGVTIIYETWPALLAIIAPILFKNQFYCLNYTDFLAIFLALIGVALIAEPLAIITGAAASDQTFGYTLAILAAITMVAAVACKHRGLKYSTTENEYDFGEVISAEIINRSIACLIAFSSSFIFERVDYEQVFKIDPSLGFGLVDGIGGLAFWIAMIYSVRGSDQLLMYIAPILSFIWLYIAGVADISIYIILGAIFIVSANILTHYRSDKSTAFSLMMFCTVLGSAVIVFMEGKNDIDSLDLIAIPISLFAIFTAFLLDRISNSNARMFESVAIFLSHAKENYSYTQFRKTVDLVFSLISSYRVVEFSKISKEEEFSNSKNPHSIRALTAMIPSIAFGEKIVLFFVSFVVICSLVLFRPETFFGDLMSIALIAAVSFLYSLVVSYRRSHEVIQFKTIIRNEYGIRTEVDSNTEDEEDGYESTKFAAVLLYLIISICLVIALAEKHYALLSS